MGASSIPSAAPRVARLRAWRDSRLGSRLLPGRPELAGLLGLAALLNLWGLAINGWANTYYSAAVRSMGTSWHAFLFASLDKTGLMTVDKPPLSLWVQALSARMFGYHPLSLLIPQALMGIAAVALVYDLTARRFGRPAGFVAGLVLATTPVIVAVSRHNNPDELLMLCSVAAVWCALRALEDGGTRWLVLSGVAVGLGFETKMGVALIVVPGIAAAWIWMRAERLRSAFVAFRQLLAGGAAMVLVGGAWPLLVMLTPAAERPWISGTSDNSIISLIFGYNGLGRIAGQSGGPGGGGPAGGPGGGAGNTMFGGATGPFRLLQSGLGDQAGWLLGFALVSALAILVCSRMRRRDPRSGWLLVLGGALLCSAVAFSFAQGIFHPYYVSLLAPFAAALVGAGAGQILAAERSGRLIAPLAIGAGIVTELIVLNELHGALPWAVPVIVVLGGGCGLALARELAGPTRALLLAGALAALLAAPAAWAAETLNHATSATFPTGGPTSASAGPGGTGGPGGPGTRGPGGPGGAAGPGGLVGPGGAGGLVGPGGAGGPGGLVGPGGPGAFGGAAGPGGPGAPVGFGGYSAQMKAAVRYATAHGGGTIGVSSQSSAAEAIIASDATVAGLGGFSGRESSLSVSWLRSEIASGRLRWILADEGTSVRPGDTRRGSTAAIAFVTRTCQAIKLSGQPAEGSSAVGVKMYDCRGRSAALLKGSSK